MGIELKLPLLHKLVNYVQRLVSSAFVVLVSTSTTVVADEAISG